MSAIDPLNTSLYFTAAAQAAQRKRQDDGKKTDKPQKMRFTELLSKADEAETLDEAQIPAELQQLPYEQAARVLIDAVYISGDELKKHCSPDTIVQYRKAVRNFMQFVVKSSYDIDSHESAKSIKKRKKFYCLRIIDEKLDQLATGVLYNNRDQLQILAKIDEINGLLVDLLS